MKKVGFNYHEFLDMPYHFMCRIIDRHVDFETEKNIAIEKARSGVRDGTPSDASAMFGGR